MFPHTLLHPISPHVFSSTFFVPNLPPSLYKLSARPIKCVFLGYHRSQKGYRCFSPTFNCYFIFGDVSFFESVPYFEFVSIFSDIEQSIPLEILLLLLVPLYHRKTHLSILLRTDHLRYITDILNH